MNAPNDTLLLSLRLGSVTHCTLKVDVAFRPLPRFLILQSNYIVLEDFTKHLRHGKGDQLHKQHQSCSNFAHHQAHEKTGGHFNLPDLSFDSGVTDALPPVQT